MLGNVGGLFSIIFILIEFICASYNEFRFELAVGEVLFKYDKDGNQVKEEDMGVLTYLKYIFFDWLPFIRCNTEYYRDMTKISETRE